LLSTLSTSNPVEVPKEGQSTLLQSKKIEKLYNPRLKEA